MAHPSTVRRSKTAAMLAQSANVLLCDEVTDPQITSAVAANSNELLGITVAIIGLRNGGRHTRKAVIHGKVVRRGVIFSPPERDITTLFTTNCLRTIAEFGRIALLPQRNEATRRGLTLCRHHLSILPSQNADWRYGSYHQHTGNRSSSRENGAVIMTQEFLNIIPNVR